jgi:hypothetical protein
MVEADFFDMAMAAGNGRPGHVNQKRFREAKTLGSVPPFIHSKILLFPSEFLINLFIDNDLIVGND